MARSASLHVVTMPMRESFGHAAATRSSAENLVVTVDLDGVAGAGESVPREYVTGETVDGACRALRAADVPAMLRRLDLSSLESAVRGVEALDLSAVLGGDGPPAPAAACALELALLDAITRRFGEPLRAVARVLGLPPAAAARELPIPGFLDFTRDVDDLVRESDPPLSGVKVKVGRSLAEDVARVGALRRQLGATVPIWVDANMAWSADDARRAIAALQPFDVRWFEEPLAKGSWDAYRELRGATGAAIMLDESLCTLADARRAISARACDHFNVRLSKCGGFLPSLRLIALARANGLGFQIGVHVGEMAVLWAAGLQLASAADGFLAFEAGMPDRFFARQLVREPVSTDWRRRRVVPLAGPGLGVTIDRDALAGSTRATWPLERAATG